LLASFQLSPNWKIDQSTKILVLIVLAVLAYWTLPKKLDTFVDCGNFAPFTPSVLSPPIPQDLTYSPLLTNPNPTNNEINDISSYASLISDKFSPDIKDSNNLNYSSYVFGSTLQTRQTDL